MATCNYASDTSPYFRVGGCRGRIFFLDYFELYLQRYPGIQFAFQIREDARVLEQKISDRASSVDESIIATKTQTDELYVVVLGESANKYHFSLYNYPRTTNPLLEQLNDDGDLVVQKHGYSNGINTVGTQKYALTSAHINSSLSPSQSPSVVETLNKAGIDTYWIHNGSTAATSNILSIIAGQSGS